MFEILDSLLVGLVRGIVRDLIADFVATLAARLPAWLAEAGVTLGIATPWVVAQVSARQLAAGRSFCFLFTNLANPTSNRIYQAIGYTPVVDVDQYKFA